ncbi:hypothetical protein [Ekhidna sp.]|uniref:hypothetical protein n=1 Tax=Ekhidna sp. TaxID=2608089 RepID=UPI003297EB90
MKKIIPFLLISCIWFIGCGDDDSSGNLIGTWVATSILVSDCQDGNRNGANDVSCDEVSCYRLALNGDDTYSFQRGLGTDNGTWDVGDFLRLCMTEEGETSCEQFAVQFSGISMILIADSTSAGCVSTYFFNPETQADTIQ